MLVAKPRNQKWRLISRTCCPPPAAALRAAWGACGALGRAARACFGGATSTEKMPFFLLGAQTRSLPGLVVLLDLWTSVSLSASIGCARIPFAICTDVTAV